MGHLIDTSKGFNAIYINGAPAWHGLNNAKVGVDYTNVQNVLDDSGLNFIVVKLPNVHCIPLANGEVIEIISEDSFFTYRTDCNKVLGTRLGRDYEVLQNIETFDVVDDILQAGTATIETAGAIDEGRKVFVLLKIKQDIQVGIGDIVKQYVLIATSFDTSISTTVMPTNTRVVCNNTLTAALRGAIGKIKIRHTKNAKERLAEAAKVLKLIANNTEVNQQNYNTMLDTKISAEQMFNYFGNVFCTGQEIAALQAGGKATDVLSGRKQNILNDVLAFANNGAGQRLTHNEGNLTMWTAYNAVTGYVSRKKFKSFDDRADSMLFGHSAGMIEEAGKLALAPQKIVPMHKTNFKSDFNLN